MAWLRLSTSSCAISSINHPARKRPFQFRHESPLRFADDEQPSESGRFGQKSCRYGFICRESKLRWWQTWQFLILKESRCRPSVNLGYRECDAFLSTFQRTALRTLKFFAPDNRNQFFFAIYESLMLKSAFQSLFWVKSWFKPEKNRRFFVFPRDKIGKKFIFLFD